MRQKECLSTVIPLMALGLCCMQPLMAHEQITKPTVVMSQVTDLNGQFTLSIQHAQQEGG